MPVFAFTDIEGSTGLWEKHQGAMGPVIAKHYAILHRLLDQYGGRIVKKTGDGVFAIFPDEVAGVPSPALGCAIELQRNFQDEAWPVIGELRVRMAFHCGEAEEMAGDYYGPTANRTARFMSLAWGGQILVSEDLQRVATLPKGAEWQDLGFHQVKDLPEPLHFFGLLHPGLKLREFPALKSLSNRPHNLPEQLSAFAGRRRDLKAIAAMLEGRNRLVTLLGGAGMGKTRLAIQAAEENLASFKHGANLVNLESLDSAEQVPARIAESLKLGLYRQKEPRDQVLDYLKDKTLLMILDPCERLSGSLGFVSEALEACPGLKVLACSRRRLHLRGESVLEVRGMDHPAEAPSEGFASFGAAKIFVRQVQGFNPTYSLTPGEQVPFLKVCILLQGMPLGLELAAGWLRSMPLAQVAEHLEKDPRFLASTRTDLPESHRSLKDLFESTWSQLTESERAALARVSAFRSGFLLKTAQLLFQVRPETLGSLVDQGLLHEGEDGRSALPEWVRFFAAAKLEESPAKRDQVNDLLARYFCRFLKERERNLMGQDQARAIGEIRQEFPNIQRGWDRACERGWVREIGQAARCIGLYTDMQGLARDWEPRMERALQFWEGSGVQHLEGLPWEEALSGHAGLLANQANYLFSLGRSVPAREKMEKSLALCRKANQPSGVAYSLVRIAIFLGPEDERRRPALEEAASLYLGLNDANGAAWARRNLGYFLCQQGNTTEGRPLVEDSLAVFRATGNQREIAWSLNTLGQADLEAGNAEAGAQALREARDLFLELGDLQTAAWTLNTLGRAAMRARQLDEASASFEESLRLFGDIRNFRGRALALRSLCEVYAAKGDLDTAFLVVEKAVAEAQAVGDWSGQAGALMQNGHLLASRKEYDEALAMLQAAQVAFAKAGSEMGRALAMESQGNVCLQMGDLGQARGLFDAAYQVFALGGMHEGEARLCVRLGDLEAAENKPQGGEGWYKKAVKLSRQNKPGDYTLGGLMGLALLFNRMGRKLEALHLALLCEKAMAMGLMPPSDSEFYAELGRRAKSALSQVSARLMQNMIDEARAKLYREDLRSQLRESVEKYWS